MLPVEVGSRNYRGDCRLTSNSEQCGIKELFPRLDRRNIVRAAIVFDGNQERIESALKWRADFAFHQFEKEADMTVKAGSEQQEVAMRKSLKDFMPRLRWNG